MEKTTQFSHIGRTIDPGYPTNIAIVIWSVLVMVAMCGFRLISGFDMVSAGIDSVLAGITVFFVWAFAREIDPQEQLSAFVSALLMMIAVFVINVQFNLIVLFYMLSMSRIVDRSVGLPATLADSVLLLVFTGVVGLLGSWTYAMMGATMFFMDSILPNRDRKHLLFAGVAVAIMIVAFAIQNSQLNPILPTTDFIVGMVVTTLIFIPLILKSKHLAVKADITDESLTPIRVQATQVIALLFGYHVAIWQGNTGILEFLPLWLTIAGVSLFPLIKPFIPNWDLSPRNSAN